MFLKGINQRNINISLSSECLSLFKCILWEGNHARRRADTTRRELHVFPRPFLVTFFSQQIRVFIQILNGWVYFQYFTIKGSLSHQVPGLVLWAATSQEWWRLIGRWGVRACVMHSSHSSSKAVHTVKLHAWLQFIWKKVFILGHLKASSLLNGR